MISATNGKTTTAKMLASMLAPERRLCRNTAGANLDSGVASALLGSDGADLGVFEVDEAALPGVVARLRPRVTVLGNLFRDQLDRYGELEAIAARWQEMTAALPATRTWPETATIRCSPRSRTPARCSRSVSRMRGRRCPRCSMRATRSGARPAGRGSSTSASTSATWAIGAAPAAAAAARARRLGRHGRAAGARRHPVRAAHAARRRGGRAAVPGLYNVYNALAAAAAACAVGGRRRRAHRLAASSGSTPPSDALSGCASASATPCCSWRRTRPGRTS